MKKILSLVFMVAAMMYATSANAQIKFGLKGGLNVTSMSFSEDVFDASNKTGFFVGPMVKGYCAYRRLELRCCSFVRPERG